MFANNHPCPHPVRSFEHNRLKMSLPFTVWPNIAMPISAEY